MATVTPTRPPLLNNLANQLTAARLVLALVLFLLIAAQQWLWCLLVFAVAALTDWLDGYFARKQGLATSLGRQFDPLVDKVLMCGAFIFLLPLGAAAPEMWLLPWMVTVVVARELIITGLRGFMETRNADFGADWLGKLKMGLQCAALVAIFVALEAAARWPESGAARFTAHTRDALVWAMLGGTALSGFQYLWRAAALLKDESF